MKKQHYILLAIVFLLTTNSCVDWFTVNDEYYSVTIENNSVDTIYVDFTCGENVQSYNFEELQDYYLDSILPESSMTVPYIEKLPHYSRDQIALIVLKKSTYEKYTIEEIRENRIMDYGVVYTYRNLEKMGFVIKYTGQEEKE